MLPVSPQTHTTASLRKNNSATSTTNGSSNSVSNEQLLTMAAPQRINALQWDLSSPGERRELLNNNAGQDQEITKASSNPADINTSVITQLRIKTLQINTAKNAAILTDTVVADNVLVENIYNEQVELDAITQQFQARFAGTAKDKTEFHKLMKNSFGAQYDVAKAETMRQQALKGDFSWMPKIQLVNGSQLADVSSTQGEGVGRGAYSQSKDTIFLSRDLLRSNPAMAEKILTEEIGHSIDARINVKDAKGDEGDIFSRLSHGENISTEELAELQTENDSGTININGEKIEVEYGWFKKLRKKVKKAFKKAVKVVSDVVSGAANIVKNVAKKAVEVVKKAGKAIIDVHKSVWEFKKNIFLKVMESKLVSKIMMVAQFIPIPIVQLVAKVYNVARAAYSVYQGVKHKSFSMVLSGVASLAGGVGKLGGALGASAGFVAKAAKIATYANTASSVHQAIATGNFMAAASAASGFFGADNKVTEFISRVKTADNVYKSVKSGDYLGAVSMGSTLLQDFTGSETDKVLQKIGDNSAVINGVQKAIKNGDYGDAASILTSVYGNDMNISAKDQDTIQKVSYTYTRLQKAKDHVENNDYAAAAQELFDAGQVVVNSPKVRLQLAKAGATMKQVDNTITAVKEGRYGDAVNLAATTLGKPLDDNTRDIVENIQTYASKIQAINNLLQSGDKKGALKELKNLLKDTGVLDKAKKVLKDSDIAKELKTLLEKADATPEVATLVSTSSETNKPAGASSEANTKTDNVVKFQQKPKLEQSTNATLNITIPQGVVLDKGSRGKHVMLLQQQLQNAGFNPGSADGIFGTRTKSALKAFQHSNNLVSDGIAGSKTWGALGVTITPVASAISSPLPSAASSTETSPIINGDFASNPTQQTSGGNQAGGSQTVVASTESIPTNTPISSSATAVSQLAEVDQLPQEDRNFLDGAIQGIKDTGTDFVNAGKLAYALATDSAERQKFMDSIDKLVEAVNDPERRVETLKLIGSELGEGIVEAFTNFSNDRDYYGGYITGTIAAGGAIGKLAKVAATAAKLDKITGSTAGLGSSALRLEYVSRVNALTNKATAMRKAGASGESIARTLHAERRALGVEFKNLTPPDMLEKIYARNIEKYGDKLGPTIDYLRNRGKSWDDIIESSTRTGGKDLGLSTAKANNVDSNQVKLENKPTTADLIKKRVIENKGLMNSPQLSVDMKNVGVTQQQIQLMKAKILPLGFKNEAQFKQFKLDLDTSLKEAGLNDADIGLTGTSTTFYSENPGKRTGHHWDADPKNIGDFDFNITSSTMVKKFKEAGREASEKYGVFTRHYIQTTFPALDSFRIKWSNILNREVNFAGYPKPVPRDPTEFILRVTN